MISHSVTQRLPEIGIRLALGAMGWEGLRMILGPGLQLAVKGLVADTVAAILLGRLVAFAIWCGSL